MIITDPVLTPNRTLNHEGHWQSGWSEFPQNWLLSLFFMHLANRTWSSTYFDCCNNLHLFWVYNTIGETKAVWPSLKNGGWLSGEGWQTHSEATHAGAGGAQWLERRTRDRKVPGLSPGRSDGRTFFSRINSLCWLFFRYPFHPRVTTIAHKTSRSFCKRCRWQVTAEHTCTLRMWLYMK